MRLSLKAMPPSSEDEDEEIALLNETESQGHTALV